MDNENRKEKHKIGVTTIITILLEIVIKLALEKVFDLHIDIFYYITIFYVTLIFIFIYLVRKKKFDNKNIITLIFSSSSYFYIIYAVNHFTHFLFKYDKNITENKEVLMKANFLNCKILLLIIGFLLLNSVIYCVRLAKNKKNDENKLKDVINSFKNL